MARKRRRKSKVPAVVGPRYVPSPQEVIDGLSAKGGWTAKTLASWGIKWPPQKGWRRKLEAEYFSLVRADAEMEQIRRGEIT